VREQPWQAMGMSVGCRAEDKIRPASDAPGRLPRTRHVGANPKALSVCFTVLRKRPNNSDNPLGELVLSGLPDIADNRLGVVQEFFSRSTVVPIS
jgi:hypothetical protein